MPIDHEGIDYASGFGYPTLAPDQPTDGATHVAVSQDVVVRVLFDLSRIPIWVTEGTYTFLRFGTSNPPPHVPGGIWGSVIGGLFRYDPGALVPNTTYFWQIWMRTDWGVVSSPVWSFTTIDGTPPDAPVPLSPDDGENIITLSPILTWQSTGATTYDVYFGTSNPPSLVSSGQAGATYAPGALASGTEYFWKIVAHNAFGDATGAVWSFTEDLDLMTVLTSTSTGTLDNFNPGALTTLNILRMNNASLATIRGLTNNGSAPTDGQQVWIESVGAGQVDIANQDTNSTAANRVINNVTGTISLAAGSGRALLAYDGTTGRWRVLEHEQGAWIDVTYSAGDYTGSGSMTVTPGSAVLHRYWLKGRTLHLELGGVNWTIGGTPSTAIRALIPGGFSAASSVYVMMCRSRDNGTYGTAIAKPGDPDATHIAFYKDVTGVATWAASTIVSGVTCNIAFDVQ